MLNVLEDMGFTKVPFCKSVYALHVNCFLSPAFCVRVRVKSGEMRYDGALGLTSLEFEASWCSSLEQSAKKYNNYTPLISHLDNFGTVLPQSIFTYSNDMEATNKAAISVKNYLERMPHSKEEFVNALIRGELAGITINRFLNIAQYFDKCDIKQLKSISFLKWLINTDLALENRIRAILSSEQLKIFEDFNNFRH